MRLHLIILQCKMIIPNSTKYVITSWIRKIRSNNHDNLEYIIPPADTYFILFPDNGKTKFPDNGKTKFPDNGKTKLFQIGKKLRSCTDHLSVRLTPSYSAVSYKLSLFSDPYTINNTRIYYRYHNILIQYHWAICASRTRLNITVQNMSAYRMVPKTHHDRYSTYNHYNSLLD